MLESCVELFKIMEEWFGKETAIWMVICGILTIILTGVNSMGVPESITKKTGEDKWTTFTFNRK